MALPDINKKIIMALQSLNELLPELVQIELILAQSHRYLDVEEICGITVAQRRVSVYAISLGSKHHNTPCITFVGGIHGLERIGTQVVLAFLETLIERLQWDLALDNILQRVRINFLPLINPAGMANHTRANGQGVDLMRNAPVDSLEPVLYLGGGQRYSSRLPWYRGAADSPMQKEAQSLCDYVVKNLFAAPVSLLMDCHSGFGYHDRIWFPYAKSRIHPIQHIGDMYQLRELFLQTFPHQNYLFEPQSKHYLTHGDLWDYLYDISLEKKTTFLPLTLEMGSWRWIRKNPMQLFNMLGLFHPIKPHRVKRVLRGHLVLMEFLVHAALSYQNWIDTAQSEEMTKRAKEFWYGQS